MDAVRELYSNQQVDAYTLNLTIESTRYSKAVAEENKQRFVELSFHTVIPARFVRNIFEKEETNLHMESKSLKSFKFNENSISKAAVKLGST